MAVTSQVERLRALAVPAVQRAGLVLEDVSVTPVGRRRLLRVTVDLPEDVRGGVPVDAVATASQALSQALDDSDVMGGTPYVLEVSSPGVDRPLSERRHWKRARGRLVVVRLADGRQAEGRLTAVGEDGVTVAGRLVPWAEVASGRVEIEFGRLPEEDDPDDTGQPDPDDTDPDDTDPDHTDPDDTDPDDTDPDDTDPDHTDDAEGSA